MILTVDLRSDLMPHFPNPADYDDLILARERQLARAMRHGNKLIVGIGNPFATDFRDLDRILSDFRGQEFPNYCCIGEVEDRLIAWILFFEDTLAALYVESRQGVLFAPELLASPSA